MDQTQNLRPPAAPSTDAAAKIQGPGEDEDISVEVGIHDASQFEWRVGLPIPRRGRLKYSVDAEFELPSSAVTSRSPWDQLQGFSRLEGPPTPAGPDGAVVSAESIGRQVLGLQQMLRRAREGVLRHCRLISDSEDKVKSGNTAQFLTSWLAAARKTFQSARQELSGWRSGELPEIARERALADEWISVKWLDFLADARSRVDTTLRPRAAENAAIAGLLTLMDEELAKELEAEIAYRKAKGHQIADASSPASLENYVERGGWLKKHFESRLVLDREAMPIDDQLRTWFTSFAAILAGASAFALQFLILHHSSVVRIGWGLLGIAFLMGAAYAMRERIKELARSWITGRVYRFYAQRVVRCRTQAADRADPEVAIEAREWCNETTCSRPDPVSPESGASRRATLVSHLHRGVVKSSPQLAASGALRIRQIFRYDLSPLFPRLQDPVKRIPVFDPQTSRSHFVDAPRRYQVPVRVVVHCGELSREAFIALVVDKQGIVRTEKPLW